MSEHWDSAPLGDLAELRKGVSYKGAFLDKPGPPLLGLGAFRAGGGYLSGKERTYGGPHKPHHLLEPGQLFLALTDITQEGHVLGSPAFVPSKLGPSLITHHVAAVRTKRDAQVDLGFLYYVLCSDTSRAHFRGMATGTTVRAVSIRDASRIELPLPPLEVQKRIARVLGAMDARISVLERMSRTLEEIALTVFRSWFVNFEREEELVTGELGPQPPGWTVGHLDGIVEFNPKVRVKKGEEVPFLNMKALPTSGASVVSHATKRYSGGSRFQNGDTLFARITPCLENGKCALVDFLGQDVVGAGSTEFIVMRPRAGVPVGLPYCWARHEPFRRYAIANMTGSSGRQRVSFSVLKAYPALVPPQDVMDRFGALTNPMFASISSYTRQASKLAAMRDILLPRLISGALPVSDLSV